MAEEKLEEIRSIRLHKISELKKLGINPYPSKVKGLHEPVSIVRTHLDDKRAVTGRLMGWREHGNVIFADLKVPEAAHERVAPAGELLELATEKVSSTLKFINLLTSG